MDRVTAGVRIDRLLARRIGPFSGRVWGLVLNLAANAVALWGVASLLRTGSGWGWIAGGGAATVLCVAVLARPDRAKVDATQGYGGTGEATDGDTAM